MLHRPTRKAVKVVAWAKLSFPMRDSNTARRRGHGGIISRIARAHRSALVESSVARVDMEFAGAGKWPGKPRKVILVPAVDFSAFKEIPTTSQNLITQLGAPVAELVGVRKQKSPKYPKVGIGRIRAREVVKMREKQLQWSTEAVLPGSCARVAKPNHLSRRGAHIVTAAKGDPSSVIGKNPQADRWPILPNAHSRPTLRNKWIDSEMRPHLQSEMGVWATREVWDIGSFRPSQPLSLESCGAPNLKALIMGELGPASKFPSKSRMRGAASQPSWTWAIASVHSDSAWRTGVRLAREIKREAFPLNKEDGSTGKVVIFGRNGKVNRLDNRPVIGKPKTNCARHAAAEIPRNSDKRAHKECNFPVAWRMLSGVTEYRWSVCFRDKEARTPRRPS